MKHPFSSIVTVLSLLGLVLLPAGVSDAKTDKADTKPIVAPPYQFQSQWHELVGDYGKFDRPVDVGVDRNHNIYVADAILRAVFKFDAYGKLLDVFKGTDENNRMARPSRIAIDVNTIYIADRYEGKIHRFDLDGKQLSSWKLRGGGPGQLSEALGICVDPLGQLYVVDHINDRILSYSSDGSFISSFGEKGEKPGQLFGATDIACDAEGNIVVIDFNDRIQRFAPDGTLLQSLGERGTEPGQFDDPLGIALDIEGALYIADTANSRVQKIIIPAPKETTTKKKRKSRKAKSPPLIVSVWGQNAGSASQLRRPSGLTVMPDGTVIVADQKAGTVSFWRPAELSEPPTPE